MGTNKVAHHHALAFSAKEDEAYLGHTACSIDMEKAIRLGTIEIDANGDGVFEKSIREALSGHVVHGVKLDIGKIRAKVYMVIEDVELSGFGED